jgi:hypothetical protein
MVVFPDHGRFLRRYALRDTLVLALFVGASLRRCQAVVGRFAAPVSIRGGEPCKVVFILIN